MSQVQVLLPFVVVPAAVAALVVAEEEAVVEEVVALVPLQLRQPVLVPVRLSKLNPG
ncbi:MAG: hypothetical protein ISS58_08025 [Dehalococcoidales bacterium]|nr:hypothetical protein [Dehalococcoidales bacterium]